MLQMASQPIGGGYSYHVTTVDQSGAGTALLSARIPRNYFPSRMGRDDCDERRLNKTNSRGMSKIFFIIVKYFLFLLKYLFIYTGLKYKESKKGRKDRSSVVSPRHLSAPCCQVDSVSDDTPPLATSHCSDIVTTQHSSWSSLPPVLGKLSRLRYQDGCRKVLLVYPDPP